MKTIAKFTTQSLIACALGWSLPANTIDADTAIKSADFAGFFSSAAALLKAKVDARNDETALDSMLNDPAFANTLDRWQLVVKIGVDKLGVFATADPANRAFLGWLLGSTEAMDQYLDAHVPIHLAAREKNDYKISPGPLEMWKKIIAADPDAKIGIPMKIAIATAIRPPGTGAPGAGQQKTPSDPLVRYKYYKDAHKNRELFPSFDKLTAWDMQYVVSSGASEADLTWGRQMINTWRPDLRINELVVNSTSEVWRRNSPIDFANTYQNVLTGGGKCGPRSSWSVFICQAFGVPAIGVGQPAHACVAYKTVNPTTEPQPGYAWKVGYGRGWPFSKLENMGGVDFIAGVQEREHRAAFSKVERLRWLAAAVGGSEQATLMDKARKIQASVKDVRADLTASAKADEAEKELIPGAAAAPVAAATKGPAVIAASGSSIEASAFSSMQAVRVINYFTGGKQVNFDKSVPTSWIEYTVDAPAAGTYVLQLKAATPNDGQFFDVIAGTDAPVNLQIPNTRGLWGMTPAVEIKLQKGPQKLKISSPPQRGVAVRHLEIKAKG